MRVRASRCFTSCNSPCGAVASRASASCWGAADWVLTSPGSMPPWDSCRCCSRRCWGMWPTASWLRRACSGCATLPRPWRWRRRGSTRRVIRRCGSLLSSRCGSCSSAAICPHWRWPTPQRSLCWHGRDCGPWTPSRPYVFGERWDSWPQCGSSTAPIGTTAPSDLRSTTCTRLRNTASSTRRGCCSAPPS